ncbi:MAG TPA: class II aldolase/adducin family protein [Anaerolineales bacterium]|nr:class II aldolase/adducin family protein [Anaerolineales bacterium]
MSDAAIRERILKIAKEMYARDFIAGIAGNISTRLGPDRLLITPSGVNKAEMSAGDLLVIDLEGNCLEGKAVCRPTSELPMHLEAYRRRPDVGAVVHAHPITCVALSLVGISLAPPYIPEALVLLGPVATAPYATPSSTENRDAIAGLIVDHDAIILAHHGTLTVGKDLDEAFERLEVLEHTARTVALAHQLGKPRELSPGAVERLLGMRAEMGLGKGEESPLSLKIAAEVERIYGKIPLSGR